MTPKEKEQIQAVITTYKQWRMVPVVDDEFPEMMEKFELEMARLERMVK